MIARLASNLEILGQNLARFVASALAFTFAPASAKPWPSRAALPLLAVAGVAHWLWFFSGPLALDFEDWPKERAYLDLLREAVATRTPPLHMDINLQMTQRFLALPETMLAPHVTLLPWLTNQQFVTLQTALMFLLGLAGCAALARRFDWSAFTLVAFATVFSFNGFITCRLACGHFMWAGYYLFPWMLLATLRLRENPAALRRRLELAGVIFALFLVGSFHLAIWWMIFLAILALASPRLLWPIGLALAAAVVLCLFRIAPAAVTFGGLHREFGTGYPDLLVLARAFFVSLGYDTPFTTTTRASLGWWEFNHFVGLPAALFVLVYCLKRPADTIPQAQSAAPASASAPSRIVLSSLLLPTAAMAVLSLSDFYRPIASLPLPLFNAERVTTRFISIAFFVAFFIASTRFNREAARLSPAWQTLALALLVQTIFELSRHATLWQPAFLEATHPPSRYWPDAATMTARIEPFAAELAYKLSVAASWAVSFAALFAGAALWLRAKPGPVAR
jgi:hypothetical protein